MPMLFLVASPLDPRPGLARRLPAINRTKKPPCSRGQQKGHPPCHRPGGNGDLGKDATMKCGSVRRLAKPTEKRASHSAQTRPAKFSYDTRLHVQDQLVRLPITPCATAVRPGLFGKTFDQCNREQQDKGGLGNFNPYYGVCAVKRFGERR